MARHTPSLAELDSLVAEVNGRHVRMCAKCGIREATSKRGVARCQQCKSTREHRVRPSSTERGYDAEHRRQRDKWADKVRRGNVFCWRCGDWLNPAEPWDLGHDDADRTQYRGPEHQACNRATNEAGRATAQTAPEIRRNSREW